MSDYPEMNANLFAKRQRDEEIQRFTVIWYNAMDCALDDERFDDYETAKCRAYDMVMNEEGLRLELPDNVQATELLEAYWLEQYGRPIERVPQGWVARVVGDAVILKGYRL